MKWGVRHARSVNDQANMFNRELRARSNKRKYKNGEISKEEYKKRNKKILEDFNEQARKNKAQAKKYKEDFKYDRAKFKNKYKIIN